MSTYSLARIPAISAGPGARQSLAGLAEHYAGKAGHVLLVADSGLKPTGMIDDVANIIAKAGIALSVFTEFTPDPKIAEADKAADLARRAKADLIVCLGGGSALDLGKAVAAIAGGTQGAQHYQLCENPFPAGVLKKICIPTTSGTGSETTRTSILTRADHAKVWLWGDEIKADAVILDPELTVSLPPHVTAATGIDALVHAVEAATNKYANAGNNLYAHEAIRLVAHNLLKALENPKDIAAREALQRAAAYGGIAIDNCGTAIAHNIGHALGSLKPIHHGHAVGVAMLASMQWNIADDDGAYAASAAAMGVPATAQDFAKAYEKLLRASGVRIDLSQQFADVSPQTLAAQMARPENAAMLSSNKRAASEADLRMLAEAVLTQV